MLCVEEVSCYGYPEFISQMVTDTNQLGKFQRCKLTYFSHCKHLLFFEGKFNIKLYVLRIMYENVLSMVILKAITLFFYVKVHYHLFGFLN